MPCGSPAFDDRHQPDLCREGQIGVPDGPRIIWLEDFAHTIGTGRKLLASLLALAAPARFIERACGQDGPRSRWMLSPPSFSAAAAPGEPKGVMLSHFNIDANARASRRSSICTSMSESWAFFPSFIRSAISSFGSSCSTTRAWSFIRPRSTSPRSANCAPAAAHVPRDHADLSPAVSAPLYAGTIQLATRRR